EHGVATGLLPEFLDDQRRAPAAGPDDGEMPLTRLGEEEDLLGEACSGGEQAIDLAAVLQVVEAAEGGEDALAGPAVLPVVFDDLEIGAGPGFLGAEEHGGLLKEPLGG